MEILDNGPTHPTTKNLVLNEGRKTILLDISEPLGVVARSHGVECRYYRREQLSSEEKEVVVEK